MQTMASLLVGRQVLAYSRTPKHRGSRISIPFVFAKLGA